MICPNCGYCRHCGRGGCRHIRPWRPAPWPGYPHPYVGDPIGPYWQVGGALAQARDALGS